MLIARYLPWLVFILVCVVSSVMAIRNPACSTDMLFYTALARQHQGVDARVIHQKSYDMVKRHVESKQNGSFLNMDIWVDGGLQYHRDLYGNTNAFVQQFPFFKIRIVYTYFISLLSRIGFGLVEATQFISILASLLGALLLFFNLKKRNKFAWWIGIIYVYSMIDAVVDAHLYSFDQLMDSPLKQTANEEIDYEK